MRAISASPRSLSTPLESGRGSFSSVSFSPLSPPFPVSSTLKPKCLRGFSRFRIYCSNRQGFDSGGNDSKTVLDAFFLGKAVAEALTERIEATVGEFVSVIGQWQAEQRKQVQDLQEEVFERATKAKEKAAREALEEKGIILKSTMTPVDAGTPAVEPLTPSPSNGGPLQYTKED
ncbi:hypothetical protein MRB53_015896 [Persea americana]|uniref:Uncharacterized protein n=1 Tax=Persea americana TaxID=3435 RepID=A0ACC2M0J8_PERAE|nr:hypothetical protein MRB53_015896 [Persea americana]